MSDPRPARPCVPRVLERLGGSPVMFRFGRTSGARIRPRGRSSFTLALADVAASWTRGVEPVTGASEIAHALPKFSQLHIGRFSPFAGERRRDAYLLR